MAILTRLVPWLVAAVSLAAGDAPAEVAYIRDGALHLVTREGSVVRVVKTRVPIGSFAVAPDLSRVVFVPLGNSYGGPLYLLTVGDGRLRLLSSRPYWPPVPKTANREVYADPEFSPNGKSVVFAIRDIPRSGRTDMVEASGPLAVMDIGTGGVRLLRSTLNVEGQGPAFANRPQWSPDGTRILVSFETGFGIVSVDGKELWVPEPSLPSEYGWSAALGWLGNNCILCGFGHNGVVEGSMILQLPAGRAAEPSRRLGFALSPQQGLDEVWVSDSLVMVGTVTETRLFDGATCQFLKRFPPGAKLLYPRAQSVRGWE